MDRSVIELLSPARDLECGRVAIDHGADAVYIGAPKFGARKAASVTLDDVARLCEYAHVRGCRVHVALNTLLFDAEVAEARRLAWRLYEAGADALIVQDAALFPQTCDGALPDGSRAMPPIELHASTQCDNRSSDKVLFFERVGFRQVVLARELSVAQVAQVAAATTVRLEAFVHGALCVGLSGRCYMSLAAGGRSANRGECAQPCRLRYRLLGQGGDTVAQGHLLSLKDNNQTAHLAALLDAGVSAFKIEGRLKGPDYVANVTLHYREALDAALRDRPELRRLASTLVTPGFQPDPRRSFNRGFTDYCARGRHAGLWQPATCKSLGQPLGTVVERAPGCLTLRTDEQVNNGDGLLLLPVDEGRAPGARGGLSASSPGARGGSSLASAPGVRGVSPSAGVVGMRVGSVLARRGPVVELSVRDEAHGPSCRGWMAYRNSDVAFDRLLATERGSALVPLDMRLSWADGIFELSVTDPDGVASTVRRPLSSEPARDPEAVERRTGEALAKLGGSPFTARGVSVDDSARARALPLSQLNALRREAAERHAASRLAWWETRRLVECHADDTAPYPTTRLDAEANVVNAQARLFYQRHGVTDIAPGHDLRRPAAGTVVMRSWHCVLRELGLCRRANKTLAERHGGDTQESSSHGPRDDYKQATAAYELRFEGGLDDPLPSAYPRQPRPPRTAACDQTDAARTAAYDLLTDCEACQMMLRVKRT